MFARAQEGCKKDAKITLGRMLAKWHVLARASRSWKPNTFFSGKMFHASRYDSYIPLISAI